MSCKHTATAAAAAGQRQTMQSALYPKMISRRPREAVHVVTVLLPTTAISRQPDSDRQHNAAARALSRHCNIAYGHRVVLDAAPLLAPHSF
jgi:hypothetical protein